MRFLATLAALLWAISLPAQSEIIRLFPLAAPGSESWKLPEQADTIPGTDLVFVNNVSVPTLTVYRPKTPNGTAVIVCPGGAFRVLALEHEGRQVAEWLTSKGITALVLKYRVVHAPVGFDSLFQRDLQTNNFARIDSINAPFVPLAVVDGRSAVRYVRSHATELGVSSDRVGMLGFSAGATLAVAVTQSPDAASRPNFLGLVYGYAGEIYSRSLPQNPPPMFLTYAANDPLSAGNSNLYRRWITAGGAAEMHVYPDGGHGFGLRKQGLAVDAWTERFTDWLEMQDLLLTPQTAAWMSRYSRVDRMQGKIWGDQRLRNDWAWLKRFEADNAKVPAPKKSEKRVVFMGNSITEGWPREDSTFWKGKPYINRGISGQTTPQMLVRFRPDVLNLRPDVVVILAGTNDIAGNTGETTVETAFGNIASMADLAQANGIKVVLCAVVPAFDYPWKPGLQPAEKIVQLNALIKAYAAQRGHVYVDYHTAMRDERNGLRADLGDDGVHPNQAGYRIMGPLVEAGIAQALKKK